MNTSAKETNGRKGSHAEPAAVPVNVLTEFEELSLSVRDTISVTDSLSSSSTLEAECSPELGTYLANVQAWVRGLEEGEQNSDLCGVSERFEKALQEGRVSVEEMSADSLNEKFINEQIRAKEARFNEERYNQISTPYDLTQAEQQPVTVIKQKNTFLVIQGNHRILKYAHPIDNKERDPLYAVCYASVDDYLTVIGHISDAAYFPEYDPGKSPARKRSRR